MFCISVNVMMGERGRCWWLRGVRGKSVRAKRGRAGDAAMVSGRSPLWVGGTTGILVLIVMKSGEELLLRASAAGPPRCRRENVFFVQEGHCGYMPD